MELQLGTFPVQDIRFGGRTQWQDGILEIDEAGLLDAVKADQRIVSAELKLAKPGESVRITRVHDVLEPRIKVSGSGSVYPGICGRSAATVGDGRTHRLQGMGVVPIGEISSGRSGGQAGYTFLDMMEPGAAATPYGSLQNLCVIAQPDTSLTVEEQAYALEKAALVVSDMVAATTLGLDPPELEELSLSDVDPSLPRVVYICAFNSPQHFAASLSAYGTAIYGFTRQTPPWLLHPNELLDGAICAKNSWMLVNNPSLLNLYRGHGREVNFVGCIAIRTRWSSQSDKDVTSQQAAKMASMLKADGAIVTWDAAGNDFLEVIRTVQACENLGIKTVFITPEEHPDIDGPPVLEPLPEARTIVSSGVGLERRWIDDPVPAPEQVIGPADLIEDANTFEGVVSAFDSLPSHRWVDHYGFGRRTGFDY